MNNYQDYYEKKQRRAELANPSPVHLKHICIDEDICRHIIVNVLWKESKDSAHDGSFREWD